MRGWVRWLLAGVGLGLVGCEAGALSKGAPVELLKPAADRQTVMRQMFTLRGPGVGCGQLGVLDPAQLDQCAGFAIEIPATGQSRYAGYARVDNEFVLVAEFVADPMPAIAMLSVEGGMLNFHGLDRAVVKREPIPGIKLAE